MDFGQFLGNDTLKAQLSAAIDAQRLTHCYLLSGPKGSGKHTLAQLLMAAPAGAAASAARPCRAFTRILPLWTTPVARPSRWI